MIRRSMWLLVVLLSGVSTLQAENWSRFRGPNGQGVSDETGVPLEWSLDKNVAWHTPIPGEGWSSPIVWEDQVFVTTATNNGTICRVLCLNRKTGDIEWNQQVFEQVPLRKENKNSYATPTPVTDGERVYAVFGDGSVVALSMDGEVQWTNRDVRFYSRHGLGASPILHDGLLIMPYDGSLPPPESGKFEDFQQERIGWQIPWEKSFLVALDTSSGEEVWRADRGMSRIAHVTPVVVENDSNDLLVSPAGDVIQGFDPLSGERLWTVKSQGEGVVPSPALSNGLIITASGFEAPTIRAVQPGGEGDVTETHIAWEQRRGCPNQPSLLTIGSRLYAISDTGVISCFDANTGELLGQQRVGGNYSSSPVAADGRIYFTSESAETVVVNADPELEILTRNQLSGHAQASPAISQGNVFIRTTDGLFCVGADPSQKNSVKE